MLNAKEITMTRTILAAAIAAILGAPLVAQDMQLTGTVAEVFGQQVVVASPEGRLLVTLPEGAEVPAPGARVTLDGTRSGETFAASTLSVATATEASEAALPTALRGLGLSDVRSRPDDDGETYFHARLPDGGWLRAEARGDRLIEVQSDGVALPEALIAALLPQAVRAEPRLADIARMTEIDRDDDDGEIEIHGLAADGMRIEMEFGRTGTLQDYDRERDDRRSLSDTAARERLTALGYTEIGFVERGGRHVEVLAVNPYGEQVEVRLDEQGRIARERLWTR
jgi:hypothetical protein